VRGNRGFVYVVVLFIGLLVLAGVFTYHSTMRHGRLMAYRSLHSDYAASLAHAGLALAQSYLAHALEQADSPVCRALVRPLEEYLSAGRERIEIVPSIDLMALCPKLVERLAAELPGGRSSIRRLTASFQLAPGELSPLPAIGLTPSLTVDRSGSEKMGRLYIECTATVLFHALASGVSRTLSGYHEFRVVHCPIPLLSDFTLFVKEVDSETGSDRSSSLNRVEAGLTGIRTAGAPAVVLRNGVADLQSRMGDLLSLEFLRNQGWVYLGGPNEVVLNLTYSQEETAHPDQIGEDFHFFQQNPSNLAAGRAAADSGKKTIANRHLPSPFWEVRNWDMGVNTLKGNALQSQYEEIFASTPSSRRLGSVLKLNGAPPERISPTVVFGPVFAGFLRIAAAAPINPAKSAFDAYFTILKDRSHESHFLPAFYQELRPFVGRLPYLFDPLKSGKFVYYDPEYLGALFPVTGGVSEGDYLDLCSGFRTRNYNQALLHMKARNEGPNPSAKSVELGLPDALFNDSSTSSARNTIPKALLPPRWEALSDLNLAKVDLGRFVEPLRKAACRTVPRGTKTFDFLKAEGMLSGSELDLGTTIFSETALTLPSLTRVRRGGVIVAKEIILSGTIPASDKGVLVLVSHSGSIRLPQAPVHASLVALKGAVVVRGALDVTGNIVAQKLDLGLSPGSFTGRLNYDADKLKLRPFSTGGEAVRSDGLVIDCSRRLARVK